MEKQGLFKKPILLFLLLLLPSLFYLFLSTGETKYTRLPYYGEVNKLNQSNNYKLNLSGISPAFDSIYKQQKNGKDNYLFHFVNTVNQPSKDRILNQLTQFQLTFEKLSKLKIISLVVDSLSDEEFKSLEGNKINSKVDWKFICINDNQRIDLSERLLFKPNDTKPGNDTLILVDYNNHVRGKFDGSQYLESKELMDAVKALLAEEVIPWKENNE